MICRGLTLAFLLGLVCLAQAQSPIGGFPPGTFESRGPLDAAPIAGYSGPGDIVSGALVWYGFRGYNAAYTGHAADVCDSGGTNCITLDVISGHVSNPGATACGGGACVVVSKLYDQSGANSCSSAPCDLVQATNANRPTLTSSLQNGYPGITCSGSPAILVNAGSIDGSVTTFTVSLVAQQTSSGSFATAIGANPMISGFLGANTAVMFDGGSGTATAADNAWHSMQLMYNTVSSILNIDGSSTTGISAGSSALGTPSVCARADNNFYLTGTWLEAGIWSAQFDGTQQSNMIANQRNATLGWNF